MRDKLQGLSIEHRYALGGRLCARFAVIAAGFLIFLSLVRIAQWMTFGRGVELATAEVARAMFLGFRFDLSAVCYLFAPPVLLFGPAVLFASAPVFNICSRILRWYLTLVATLVVFLSMIEFGYYTYFQDHLNIMIFGFFEDDTKALVNTLVRNYPVFWMLGSIVVAGFLIDRGLRKLLTFRPAPNLGAPAWKLIPLYLGLIFAIALGGRGSLGLFPLGVADATISNQPFVNYLAFSGLHSLHRAIKLHLRESSSWNSNAKTYGYADAKSAARDFLEAADLPDSPDPLVWFQSKTPRNEWAAKTKPHVVVLMMESFGSSWLRYDSKEFQLLGELNRHFQEDLLFRNFVPSMTATIGSLSSLMIDTPHRPEGGFLTESRYLQVPFRTAPARIYREQGYRTRFIYGGAVGWRDIDKFARTQGFESVEGDFEIEARLKRKLEKHDWGLYDEDVWDYLQSTLEEAKSPELVVVMTTTNHPPYQLPSTYKPLPLKIPGKLESRLNVETPLAESRFRAFQYSNQKLGEFLTKLKASALAPKTLVGVTGDHGFLLVNFDQSELLQKWQVPFYLYVPAAIRPSKVDTQAFGSHADIFPTLFPLSLSEAPIATLGTNLLDPKARHDAFHFSRLALNSHGAVIVENAKTTRYLRWQDAAPTLRPSEPTPELESLAKRYKALMSFLDEYYEYERKNPRGAPKNENPGR